MSQDRTYAASTKQDSGKEQNDFAKQHPGVL